MSVHITFFITSTLFSDGLTSLLSDEMLGESLIKERNALKKIFKQITIMPVFLSVIKTVYTLQLTYKKAGGVVGQMCARVLCPILVLTAIASSFFFPVLQHTNGRQSPATLITKELIEKASNLTGEGFPGRQSTTRLQLKESLLTKRYGEILLSK